MLYEAIRLGSELYHDSGENKDGPIFDEAYAPYASRVTHRYRLDYDSIEDVIENVNDLVEFLDEWKCFPDAKAKKSVKSNLKERLPRVLSDIESLLKPLEGSTVLTLKDDVDLLKLEEAYTKLMSVKGVGHTISSKILHTIHPSLFIMWDTDIRNGYGFSNYNSRGAPAEGYVYRFLPRMQRLAEYAIRQVQVKEKRSRVDATSSLKNKDRPYTLAKVLDEYNFMKFTRNNDAVWQKEYALPNTDKLTD